ncbi:MAG: hypothetical protein GXP45_07040 [bacterium]|nr:hypothetical protein [bacterium]
MVFHQASFLQHIKFWDKTQGGSGSLSSRQYYKFLKLSYEKFLEDLQNL